MIAPRITMILLATAIAACSTPPIDVPVPPVEVRQPENLSGVWVLTVESPMGREDLETQFQQSGPRLSGYMKSGGVDVPLQGNREGEAITFDMSLDVRGQPLKLQYSGTVQGDNMVGTVQLGPMGTGKFSGVRKHGAAGDKVMR